MRSAWRLFNRPGFYQPHHSMLFCSCWFWSLLATPYCLACIRLVIGWQRPLRRNWSWWQSRSLCTCSFEGRGSPSRFVQPQTVRTAAIKRFLPFPVPNYKRKCTNRIHSWRSLAASNWPKGLRPAENTWKLKIRYYTEFIR